MQKRIAQLTGIVLALTSYTVAHAEPKAVVELFTSQGCSSCPPADTFLHELSDQDDVIALSFHVDYWNYLGWRDTFSSSENTERQRDYALVRGDRKMYTPQIVVNGRDHYVGSDRNSVEIALENASLQVPVRAIHNGDSIDIQIGEAERPGVRHTTVRLLSVKDKETVVIERGENTGRTITYRNVVHNNQPIGMWKGEAMTISLPASEMLATGSNKCVIIVQEDTPNGPGPILGATLISLPESS